MKNSNGKIISSLSHIATLGDVEEIYEVAGCANGMGLVGIVEVDVWGYFSIGIFCWNRRQR